MYTNFFSLSEPPFSIAPDPKYLFMSDRHREALTHLTYGLGGSSASSNGGFVLLTGEVGTGKTTVSRCLMADLPENTQLAFILNPTLSSQELLATICDELKIKYRKTGATLKTLTDKISEKLLKNHIGNINTILIIDEAQHLAPEVLEQLRLLTNLETDTKKLLQVILIGQPELQQLLKRRDLRQLAQRITARYHLLPLDKQELALYIKHRLSIADCHRALFNKGALATIHKLSQGIPRVVNLICHSALMEAYNSNNAVIDKKIVLKAASNALGEDFLPVAWWQKRNIQIALIISMLFVVSIFGFWLGQKKQVPVEQAPITKTQVDNNAISAITTSETAIPKILVPQDASSDKAPLEANVVVEGKEKLAALNSSENAVKPTNKAVIKHEPEKEQAQIIVSAERNNPPQRQTKKQTKSEAKTVPNAETSTRAKINDTIASNTIASNTIASNTTATNVPSNSNKAEDNYQVEAVAGVSDDLLALFKTAMDETKGESINPEQAQVSQSNNSGVKSLTQMSARIQDSVPSLRFEQHIYASDGQGWVNVNGRDRYEGDMITPDLQLSEILPQKVILIFRGEKFSLPALTNW
jgi:type II secretory pathway predicted ATPase ExeA